MVYLFGFGPLDLCVQIGEKICFAASLKVVSGFELEQLRKFFPKFASC